MLAMSAGLLLARDCFADGTQLAAVPAADGSELLVTEESRESGWSHSASIYTYLIPEGRDYAQPSLALDHDWLHLEARYNYENLDTGSAWIGYNLGGGKAVTWEFTPMLGGVFGRRFGVAPGYTGSLGWWKLELYSEGEFVFDTGDSSESFFYTWSELTFSPVEWFRFGIVAQRTRAYQSDLEIQRGFLIRFSDERFSLTACLFNPDDDKPTVVVAVGVNF
jgi:hypothetical protein